MSYLFRSVSPLVLGIGLLPSWAMADLVAQDVWDDWKAYFEGFGYSVSGDEAQSADTLTVSNIKMDLPVGVDGADGTAVMSIPTITFSEVGDGTVRVGMAPVSTISTSVEPADGEAVDMDIRYEQSGFDMIVSGSPETMTYDYSADRITMTFDNFVVDGQSLTSETGQFDVTANGITGQSIARKGNIRNVDQNMTMEDVTFKMLFNEPGTDESANVNAVMSDMRFSGSVASPDGANAADVNEMLARGFAFDGTFDYADGSTAIAFSGEDGSGTINTRSDGGSLRASMSESGLGYRIEQRGQNVDMLLPDVPLPISFSSEKSLFDVAIPVRKSDAEQDFAMAVTLEQFQMADGIWGMFDPGSQLPRDPANLVVDLSGKAKVLINYLDPLQAAALESAGAAPAELNSLNIKQILLELVGAKVAGSGSFSFDNTDLQTFDGLPRPEGALDVTVEGANALIDNLIAMGLLPEEQAMGARMMMGLFAVPGETPDTLSSKIEINAQGHVLANGQRIQ